MIEDRRDTSDDLRIAEYNALTTRITYFVTLQYAAWGIAAALFGYLAPLWWTAHSPHRHLEWVGLICVLAVSWAFLHINYEMLIIVLYLKERLLPRMGTHSAAKLDELFGFEGWLRKLGGLEDFHRNTAPSLVFVTGFLVLLVLLSRDVIHEHWAYSDNWWALVSGPLVVIVCVKMWRLSVLNGRLQD